MKNLILVFIISILMSFISCQNENSVLNNESVHHVPKDVIKLVDALHFNSDGIYAENIENFDGTKELRYFVENDISFSKAELEEMYQADKENLECVDCHYTSGYSWVRAPRVISIVGYTGRQGSRLSPVMKQGLKWAVYNYNQLGLTITFKLTFSSNTSGADIIVSRVVNGKTGGHAGFPRYGRPYKYIRLNSGMDNRSTNTNEHVITHEIGHAIGLRHSDWSTRKSCGKRGKERSNLVHIPGTPRGFDKNSLMNACYSRSTNGEFGYYDKVALRYMY